jgi:hypothetical protein
MKAEIARSIDELASIKTQCAEHKEKVNVTHNKLHKEIAGAKMKAEMVDSVRACPGECQQFQDTAR